MAGVVVAIYSTWDSSHDVAWGSAKPPAGATSDGISVLVSARGEVLQRAAHFEDGFQTLIADVPIGNGRPTIYAKWGDWLAFACGLAALGATLYAL